MKFRDASAMVPLLVQQSATAAATHELKRDPALVTWDRSLRGGDLRYQVPPAPPSIGRGGDEVVTGRDTVDWLQGPRGRVERSRLSRECNL